MKTLMGVVVLWVLVCLSGCSNGIDGLEEIPTDGLCFSAAECSPAAAASAACERGQCVYTCEPDFSDGNDDLEEGDAGDGCECGPTDVCDDGIDNDCNGQIDDGCPVCVETDEVCDGEDNDCDGQIDEGVTNPCGLCEPIADDPRCDGIDNNCDGQTDEDGEMPDPNALNACGGCDPFADNEQVGLRCDAVANGCLVCDDEGSLTCASGVRRVFFVDRDGDGFGDAAQGFELHCEPTSGFSRDAGDCDDQINEAFGINPAAQEICDNGRDDNCDGSVDETLLSFPGNTSDSQFAPVVALSNDGSSYVAAWLENAVRDDGTEGMMGQRKLVVRRFTPQTQFPLSAQEDSVVVTDDVVSSPRIAALSEDKFALAWLEGPQNNKVIKRAVVSVEEGELDITVIGAERELSVDQALLDNSKVQDIFLLSDGNDNVLLAWSFATDMPDRHQLNVKVLGDDFIRDGIPASAFERGLLNSSEAMHTIKVAYQGRYGIVVSLCQTGVTQSICFRGFDAEAGPPWLSTGRLNVQESDIAFMAVAPKSESEFVIFYTGEARESIGSVTVDVNASSTEPTTDNQYTSDSLKIRNLQWSRLDGAGVLTWVEQGVGTGGEPLGDAQIKALPFDGTNIDEDETRPIDLMLASSRLTDDLAVAPAPSLRSESNGLVWLVLAASEGAVLKPELDNAPSNYLPRAPKIRLNLSFYDFGGEVQCTGP